MLRYARFDFITWQVFRKRLIAWLARVTPPYVCFDRTPRLFDRLRQSLGRVGHGVGSTQIKTQLIRVMDVAFTALAEYALHVFGKCQFDLLLLSTQFVDGAGQLFDQRVASREVGGQGDFECRILAGCILLARCITHANHLAYTMPWMRGILKTTGKNP